MTIRELTIPLRIELCNLWYQSAFLPQFIYGVWAQVIVKVSLLLINNVSGVVDGKCYFTQKNWSSLECNFYCTISPLQQKLCPFQKNPSTRIIWTPNTQLFLSLTLQGRKWMKKFCLHAHHKGEKFHSSLKIHFLLPKMTTFIIVVRRKFSYI